MIINPTGQIVDDLYMVGHPAMPVYFLDGEKPVIFDAGLAFLDNLYTDGIREIIGNRDLHLKYFSHEWPRITTNYCHSQEHAHLQGKLNS